MTATEHPLWISYEQDLRHLLVDLDPGERAEVLAGVREHVHASLAEGANTGTDDIRAVLTGLGPPEAVAQEAYVGHRPAADSPRRRASPSLARSWVPVVVTLSQVLGLLMLLVISFGWVAYSVVETGDSTGAVTRTVNYTNSALPRLAASMMIVLPMWIPVLVLAVISDLWGRRHTFMHILLLPAAAVLLAVTPDVAWALGGEAGLRAGSWGSLALVLVGYGWALWHLTARGFTRSRDLRG
ncbi:HAAS signaling domain-containing protein [Serinicoccus sp. LYQ131]|uniref:HAAS signaling domain-containing protein n=1 Tax=Serinicoccus sp. LYQ131 TaxID=3378797 RepID=UPI003852FF37